MILARHVFFQDLRDEVQEDIYEKMRAYIQEENPREQGETQGEYDMRMDAETDDYLNRHNFPIPVAYDI